MNAKQLPHWATDHHTIQRQLQSHWAQITDYADPRVDKLLALENDLYQQAHVAYCDGRRLYEVD